MIISILVMSVFMYFQYIKSEPEVAKSLIPLVLVTIGFGAVGFVDDFKKLVIPFLEKEYDLSSKSEEFLDELLGIYQNHISHGKEIVEEVRLFFNDEITLNDEAKEFN